MNSRQKFLLGAATGLVGVLAARHAARSRRAIDFAGRVVVITGGSRGLGLVLARRLAAEGARLCLLARDQAELARASEQFPPGLDVMTLRCDIRRRADVRAAVDAILERWTAIDVLINNAGIIQVGPLEHMTTGDFENAMATHFWGPLHLMFEIVPAEAAPHLAPYCASKFALVGLSDAVRTELDQYGIRVTTVSPGLMRTGSPVRASMKGQHEAEYAWFAISDSIPGLSTSAENAASQIVEACRYGDAELTITLPAKIAMMANHVWPRAVAQAMMLANRVLPGPNLDSGERSQTGAESTSKWAPSAATVLTDKAAVVNNET